MLALDYRHPDLGKMDSTRKSRQTLGCSGSLVQLRNVLGVFIPVLAKHAKSFNLIDTLAVGVDRIWRSFKPMLH